MKDQLEALKEQIDATLARLIPSSPYHPSLYEAGRYALMGEGKRMRPLLVLISARLINAASLELALYPACALEMTHTYSLVHDDLPCMDNDDFRRGRPTLHKAFSEGQAVLAGDWLLTYAFEILGQAPHLTDAQKIALIQALALRAGGEGMIGGQIMDIEASNEIQIMHQRKTGALFQLAFEFGGIVSKASPSQMELLKTFGFQFGELFQVVDDLIDDDHPLGRERAHERMEHLSNQCFTTLKKFDGETELLEELLFRVLKKISVG